MIIRLLGISVFLLLIINESCCLKCHEGLNFTVAAIPFYYWAERQCESHSECIMQDIVIREGDFGVSVRYGGCIKRSNTPLATCEQLLNQENKATLKEYFVLLSGLDRKILNFVIDFTSKPQTQSRLWGSKFYQGIFKFLTNFGFNMTNLKTTYKNLIAEWKALELKNAFEWSRKLAKDVVVTNKATMRLSNALSDIFSFLYPTSSSDFEFLISYMPGIYYAVYSSVVGDADNFYRIISEGFEYAGVNDPRQVLAEGEMNTFFSSLIHLYLYVNDFTAVNKKTMFNFVIETIEVYEKAYPDSKTSILQHTRKSADIIFQNEELSTSSFPCSGSWLDCFVENMQGIITIRFKRTKEMSAVSEFLNFATPRAIKDSFIINKALGTKFESELNNLKTSYLKWQEQVSTNPSYLSFGTLINHISHPIIKIFNKMNNDEKKKLYKNLTPHSCKHLSCDSDLCNRHDVIEAKKSTVTPQLSGHDEL